MKFDLIIDSRPSEVAIALLKDGDTIVADLNKNELNCIELNDKNTYVKRKAIWEKEVNENKNTV